MSVDPQLAHTSEAEHPYALLGGDNERRGQKLFNTGLCLLGLALVYLGYNARVYETLHLYQGLVIFTLSFVPGLLWAKSGGSRFPIFEAIMLQCANAYAIPLLSGHEQLVLYTPEIITRAAWVVIIYQISGITAYQIAQGNRKTSAFWTEEILGKKAEKMTIYGLVLSFAYLAITTFTTWVPSALESSLRAVFFGIGILATFISSQRWGRGELSASEKILMLCALVPQLILMSVGLLLVGTISLIGIALLGFLSGGKRIPWLTIGITFAVLAVLHTGKTRMREKYWDQQLPQPTLQQLPAFFSEWISYGLEPTSGGKTVSQKMLERTSLMHILCLIADYTPARQDYLYGKTYGYVLPQLIPRLLWPDKPRAHIATFQLSIYYGLQMEEDTEKTTIAFGLLAEAFANFGFFGAIFLGTFWGLCLKKLSIWSIASPMFSFAGLFMVLLTAWALNTEFTMAAWVSSFEQAVLVVLGVPMLIRKLLG